MAGVAGIWNLQAIRLARRNEVKGVASNLLIRDRLGDLRHMTGDALIPRATRLMMRVRLDRGSVWPGLRVGAVTIET